MRVLKSLSLATSLLFTIAVFRCTDRSDPAPGRISVLPGTKELTLHPLNPIDGVEIAALVSFPDQMSQPLKTVIVLHGSGGQWQDRDNDRDGIADDCKSGLLSRQSMEWRDLLTGKGYVVVFPDSYSMRGTCENEGPYKVPPLKFEISATFIRPSDVYATIDQLKNLVSSVDGHEVVDDKNIILLGFSDGGSAVISSLFDLPAVPSGWSWVQMFNGITYSTEVKAPSNRLGEKGIKAGVAYYPGSFHNGYYGNLCQPGQAIYKAYCDILFHLPADDPLSENSECLIKTMERNGGGKAVVYRYSAVGHSFDSMNPAASDAARERTLEFIAAVFAN